MNEELFEPHDGRRAKERLEKGDPVRCIEDEAEIRSRCSSLGVS